MKIAKTSIQFKPIILSFGFILVFIDSFSQTKKEQIISLNLYADSLKQVILNQNNSISEYLVKINELNTSIVSLQKELNSSKLETATKDEEIDQLKIKILELGDSIRMLKRQNPNNFIFPYKYSQPIYIPNEGKYFSTVYLDFKQEIQIVTDSLIVKFNDKNSYHFYFFTPITEDLNIQCPEDFGYVIFDNLGRETFKNFHPNELHGNSFGGYLEFDLGSKMRRLMGLLSSGCGSGGSIQYYDLDISDEKLIQSQSINVSTGGYEFTYFLPQKKIYINGIRINPESHWSGETRYTLDFYSLINDQKIGSKVTKYIYPHFGNLGNDEIIKMIEKREPDIFKF